MGSEVTTYSHLAPVTRQNIILEESGGTELLDRSWKAGEQKLGTTHMLSVTPVTYLSN